MLELKTTVRVCAIVHTALFERPIYRVTQNTEAFQQTHKTERDE